MNEHFSVVDAYNAQLKYCEEHNAPMFVPHMGICFCCGKSVFSKTQNAGTWSVERSGKDLITGCPFCGTSFVD